MITLKKKNILLRSASIMRTRVRVTRFVNRVTSFR